MCEFCLKHGEGKKWYLQAKHYSDDLLADVDRRKFIQDFVSDTDGLRKSAGRIDWLGKIPRFVKGMLGKIITAKQKKVHYGQVVPIEDIEHIFDFVNSITRVACICRHVTVGEEKRYCYGISLNPHGGEMKKVLEGADNSFLTGPDTVGFEELTKDEALKLFREHEKEGMCHTVWTFHSPFIGGICNCDKTDCLAMRCTVGQEVPVMFKAEYIAHVDADKCTGCKKCMKVCQFNALAHDAADKKVRVEEHMCYGCGICRAVCQSDAVHLHERARSSELGTARTGGA